MEIKLIGKNNFIITDKTVLSFGTSDKDEDVIKVIVCSEMNFNIYHLADRLEDAAIGHCIYADKKRGIVLLYKIQKFDKTIMAAKCVDFIKTIENV